MTRRTKLKTFGALFLVAFLVVGFQLVRFRFFYYGYSNATVEGFVRKIQYKGPPYCKYTEVELVAQRGGDLAAGGELWKFSVDTREENAPIVQQLRAAQQSGKMANLSYRQDLHAWWRCAPTEYFVTEVRADTTPAPVAPAAPVVPAAPIVPAAPVAPAAPAK